jgi:hypothetical protein
MSRHFQVRRYIRYSARSPRKLIQSSVEHVAKGRHIGNKDNRGAKLRLYSHFDFYDIEGTLW